MHLDKDTTRPFPLTDLSSPKNTPNPETSLIPQVFLHLYLEMGDKATYVFG